MIDIGIEGIEGVFVALDALPALIQQTALQKAFQACSVPLLSALQARIPVDTGLLKTSIESEIVLDSEGRGGQLSIGFEGDEGLIARYVEYGHREVLHGKDIGQVHNHAFMRPALATSAAEVVKAFYESLMSTLVDEKELSMVDTSVQSTVEQS